MSEEIVVEWVDAAGVRWRVRNLDGTRLEREQEPGNGYFSEYGCPSTVLRRLVEECEQREIWQRTAMDRKDRIEELRSGRFQKAEAPRHFYCAPGTGSEFETRPPDPRPDPVAHLLPEHERVLRRKANHLALVVRDLLALCGSRLRPSDRALASVGCALAAYELAADECSVLRAMAEGEEGGELAAPDGPSPAYDPI